MTNNFCVYIHYTADTNTVFYVGKGYKKRAYSLYCRNAFWHRTVYKHGYYVKLIHENLTNSEACEREIELITTYRVISGDKLTNITDGGETGMSGYNHTEETKEKLRLVSLGNTHRLGNKMPIELKEKLRLINLGKKLSVDHKEKLKVINTGNTYSLGIKASEDTKAKMSLASKGKKKSDEAIAKSSANRLGQKRTQETIEKLRLAATGNKNCVGRVVSAESKEKNRLSHIGKKHSPEAIAKMIATKKANRDASKLFCDS